MTREEQKEHTKRKILDNALTEFAERGYGGSSVNHIYDPAQGISKGLLYHYFSTKDEMFLACVEECFARLKEHIHSSLSAAPVPHTIRDCLGRYYGARMEFFRQYPRYQRIFCEAAIMPPQHLLNEIRLRRRPMEELNRSTLEAALSTAVLRDGLDTTEVAAVFIRFSNFMDAQFDPPHGADAALDAYEARSMELLDMFLYGVIKEEPADV